MSDNAPGSLEICRLSPSCRLKRVLGIVSIILEVFAFIIHVLCIYAPVHIHYCDREKFVCWEFYTKRVAGARNIVCKRPFLSQNSLMIFWNSWPTITGQWSFRLTHGVVADAGWVDRVANVSRGYDDFHLTGTYYYTEKGLLIKFYACVKYWCWKSLSLLPSTIQIYIHDCRRFKEHVIGR